MATAIAVLADTFLLPSITSFQPGMPCALIQTELDGFVSLSNLEKRSYIYDRTSSTIHGLWLRHALLTKNSRILDLGLRLRRERHYANHPRLALGVLLEQTCVFGTVTHLEALHARDDVPREWSGNLGVTVLGYYREKVVESERDGNRLEEIRAIVRWLHTHHPETFTKIARGERAFVVHDDNPQFLAFLLRERLIEIDTGDIPLSCVELVAKMHPEVHTSFVRYPCVGREGLGVLKWLHSSPQFTSSGIFTSEAMDATASNGQLDVVKFLHESRTEGSSAAAMRNAAAGGYEAVVRFLREQRGEVVTPAAVRGANGNNCVEVVKYFFHSDGINFDWRERASWWTNSATRYLRRQLAIDVYNLRSPRNALEFAVKDGDVEAFRRLHERHHPDLCAESSLGLLQSAITA